MPPAQPQPNILFIMTDQQRWDALGCVGGWVRTPHLDRIAAEGVRFSNAITTSPVCVPARLSLATGHYPHSTGVWRNREHRLDPRVPTWMRALREAGYRTSLFGKTHLHPHGGDLRKEEALLHGIGLDDVDEIPGPRAAARTHSHLTACWQQHGVWDAYRADYDERFANKPWVVRPAAVPLEHYADVYVGRRACEYLEAYDRDQPWFCWVSFGGPHEPWDTPEPWNRSHDPARMPPPIPRPAWWDKANVPLGKRLKNFSAEEIPALRADYAGKVALIDDQIGRILKVLEARGELERTIICCTSDHGEHNGDFGTLYKETFLDAAMRVPLLLRTPETARTGGRVDAQPVEWIDAGPTLAAAGGAKLEYEQFGRSLLPALNGERVRDDALCEFSGAACLFTEDWKLMVSSEGRPEVLIDRRNDPLEQTNLVAENRCAGVLAELSARLLRRILGSQARAGWHDESGAAHLPQGTLLPDD